MDRFHSFLDPRLKLDFILNLAPGSEKDMPYVKNLPDCEFSSVAF